MAETPTPTTPAPDECIVRDRAAWRAWLDENESLHDGLWLVLAKRGTEEPTSLSYAQALEEALCSGWIDGQKRSRDAATFLQRFTPRRKRSIWSARNVGIVGELSAAGRMRERGLAEVAAARADGRWERAYAGQAAAEPPPEFAAALAADPEAAAAFAAVSGQARYSILHPLLTAPNAEALDRRIARALAALRG
ncbi:YdeI/OmpD-associated family protein [Leucobacter sp. M11]|uniref:YdeI/OmpD-associated family protein n=1 Tax=Leucobacter sp. M11 TaxID=2993565 RepID=UPI002D80D044|nr:YdeI/OmpD-associated family protein [Leucobacter sp. M11]MEB4615879.1 YdeI/OmpD-associated family protein [Leucobacter sp. M11]